MIHFFTSLTKENAATFEPRGAELDVDATDTTANLNAEPEPNVVAFRSISLPRHSNSNVHITLLCLSNSL
jgi:hypothetical protein